MCDNNCAFKMSFFNEHEDLNGLVALIIQDLQGSGIKVPKLKKGKPTKQDKKDNSLIFGAALASLPCVDTGHSGFVPRFIVEAFDVILKNVETEGIFRKAGSISRQKAIRQNLLSGGDISEANACDVAVLLKQFFRELPDSLVTAKLHDTFIQCYNSPGSNVKHLLSLCLILPKENIFALRYMAKMLAQVASHEVTNKMGAQNLAVVMSPNIVHNNQKSEKSLITEGNLANTQAAILKILIENCDEIGMIPPDLRECLSVYQSTNSPFFTSDDELDGDENDEPKKKRKRRSGSLQGIVLGIGSSISKKWKHRRSGSKNLNVSSVSGVSGDQAPPEAMTSLPDVTPKVMRKRKAIDDTVPFSASKRKAILLNMPVIQTPLGKGPMTPRNTRIPDKKAYCTESPNIAFVGTATTKIEFTATSSSSPGGSTPVKKKHNRFFSSPGSLRKSKRGANDNSSHNTSTTKTKKKRFFRRLSGGKTTGKSPEADEWSLPNGQLPKGLTGLKSSEELSRVVYKRHGRVPSSPARLLHAMPKATGSPHNTAVSEEQSKVNNVKVEENVSGKLKSNTSSASVTTVRSESAVEEQQKYRRDVPRFLRSARRYSQPVPTSAERSLQVNRYVSPVKEKEQGYVRKHERMSSADRGAIKRGRPNTLTNGLPFFKTMPSPLRPRITFDKSDIGLPTMVLKDEVKGQLGGLSDNEIKVNPIYFDSGDYTPKAMKQDKEDNTTNILTSSVTSLKSNMTTTSVTSLASTDCSMMSTQSDITVIEVNPLNNAMMESTLGSPEQRTTTPMSTSTENILESTHDKTLDGATSTDDVTDVLANTSTVTVTDVGLECDVISQDITDDMDRDSPATLVVKTLSLDSGICQSTESLEKIDASSKPEERQGKSVSLTNLQQHTGNRSKTMNKSTSDSGLGQYSNVQTSDHNYFKWSARQSGKKSEAAIDPVHSLEQPNAPTTTDVKEHNIIIKRQNAEPRLQISADAHNLLARAGFLPKLGGAAGDQSDITIQRNASPARMKPLGRPPLRPVSPTGATKNKPRLTSEEDEVLLKRQETHTLGLLHAEGATLPVHESVLNLPNLAKVQENVKLFSGKDDVDDLLRRRTSPLRFSQSTTRTRSRGSKGVSPVRIPTIFGKTDKEAQRMRDIARSVIIRQKTQQPIRSKGIPNLPISTNLLSSVSKDQGARLHFHTAEQDMDTTDVDTQDIQDETLARDLEHLVTPVNIPRDLKDTINDACTPLSQKLRSKFRSPLHERNAEPDDNTSHAMMKPSLTPQIKQSVLTGNIARLLRTPGNHTPRHRFKASNLSMSKKYRSPMKAVKRLGSPRSPGSPLRKSPKRFPVSPMHPISRKPKGAGLSPIPIHLKDELF